MSSRQLPNGFPKRIPWLKIDRTNVTAEEYSKIITIVVCIMLASAFVLLLLGAMKL